MIVTNFSDSKIDRYKKAIIEFKEKTSIDTLLIVPIAYDIRGRVVDGSQSLHNTQPCDLSEFWRIYDKLK